MNESQIFTDALKCASASERAAYLDVACSGDPQLRARVEALLQVHASDPSFLENAVGSFGATVDSPVARPAPSTAETAGTIIGTYKLIEQIGEGGMGTVWMAQQTDPVKRIVAVKLIKAGMDSRQVIARFEAERQALALMEHQNIARVLDAGTTNTGRPYFVMDLVKGVPITRYCDEHHFTPRQRLELFIPVCQAIQHAHQKGIIHRDLKPSNVLVALYDGKPVPKVIDFGVAKAAGQHLTDKTLVTGFGNIVGTLEYMSPEQAEINQLDVDTRSDIYSLGVLLYELLTGSTPFSRKELEKAGMLEMLRVIREQEPSKPSMKLSTADGLPTLAANRGMEPVKLTNLIRGELDWIVMKALEKHRNRRYETANGFALDVQRYLSDEAVLAGPPSAGYRFRKFARRNKAGLLTASVVAVALLVGASVAVWQAVLATQAKNVAVQAAASETTAKEMANVREAETRAVLGFVEDHILAAARPKGREGGLGSDVTLRAAIDAALPFVEKSFKGQPLTEARLRRVLGTSFLYLGDGNAATAQYEPARAIYTKLLGAEHRDTLECVRDLGRSYDLQGRTRDCVGVFEKLLAVCSSKFGSDDPLILACLNGLGKGYFDLGEYDKAIQIHEETLAAKKVKYGPGHRSTLISMLNLANVHHKQGRYEEALRLRLETLELQKANLGPKDYGTLMTAHNIGANYRKLERYADALRYDQETLTARTDTLTRDHPDTLTSLWSVGKDLMYLDRSAEGLTHLDECLQRAKGKYIHSNFRDVADVRLHHFEKAKDAAGCRTTAEMWEKLQRTDLASLYQAACCRAVTADVLGKADKSPASVKQARDETDLAMSWLHKAVACSFKDAAKIKEDKDLDVLMKEDKDLEALRDRADFKKLLAELEAKQTQHKKP